MTGETGMGRRALVAGAAAHAALIASGARAQDAGEDEMVQLDLPSFASLHATENFGYDEPTEAQKQRAREIIAATPRTRPPIDVAQSFITRFAGSEPDVISQWPVPSAWNPLVASFFDAVSGIPAGHVSDMISWCAAFANWCIERCGLDGSRSASSQSFLTDFRRVEVPRRGDLAVFTCYDPASGTSLKLGHVAFYAGPGDQDCIRAIGGNQSGNHRASTISETMMPTADRMVRRRVGSRCVPAVMRLNCYVSVS